MIVFTHDKLAFLRMSNEKSFFEKQVTSAYTEILLSSMISLNTSYMKILIVFLLLFFSAAQISGQKIIEQYFSQHDSLRIGLEKNDFLPYNDKGFTLVLPDTTNNIKGVIISLEDKKFDWQKSSEQIYNEATIRGFAVLYVSTGIPVDLYFSKKSLVYIDTIIESVFAKYHLPNKNIFFLGINLSGHRALKYIEFCKQGKSKFKPGTKGIVLCDGVLDWVRQWYEGKKGIRDNFVQSSVFEGKLLTYLLEKNLGTTPKNNLQKYLDFSTYSYFDETGRHIKYFKDYAARAYTEPATHYWLNEKRKTTFDTNFPDMVGVINELKLAGNTKSELIVINQDKSNMDKRNPNYTWSLVDKTELMNWIVSQAK